jgi:hypothetical protein
MGAGNTKASDGASFVAAYALTDRSACRSCKQRIAKGSIRIAREIPSNVIYNNDGIFTVYYHYGHGIDVAKRVKCTTARPHLRIDGLRGPDARRVRSAFVKVQDHWDRVCHQDA